MRTTLTSPILRPYALLLLVVLALIAIGGPDTFNRATIYSIFQQFSTLGPVSLALGLTMIIRHFDLSVAGMVTVSGCIAVTLGSGSPLLGSLAAIAVGLAFGFMQGVIITRLSLGSIGVTLGGLLTLSGIAYVLTGNQEIAFARLDVASLVDAPLLTLFSPRFLVAVLAFAVAAFIVSRTRIGPQVLAIGSDPGAALVAGVSVAMTTIVIFAVSGGLSALAGSLLSYSLAAASPAALSNILVPAAAAAIIGGVSLGGGSGHPLGIAGGVLVLCALQSGLTSIGVEPFIQDVATGAVLLIVGIADSRELPRRIDDIRRWRARAPHPQQPVSEQR